MKTKIILLVTLAVILFLSSSAFAQEAKTQAMRLPYSFCLDANTYEQRFQKPYTQENISSCLKMAYPYSVAECESLSPTLGEGVRDSCFLKLRACDRISSSEVKQQCESEKTSLAAKGAVDSAWTGACLIIPIIVLILIISAVAEIIRKKMTWKKAALIVLAIIVLSIIWVFLVVLAPCNVCLTMCVY